MSKSKKSDTGKAGKIKKAEKSAKDKPAKPKKSDEKKSVVKAIAKPAPAVPKPKKTVAPTPVISLDDISLRAYFIAERRQAMGWPGDSTSDWVEAERQLKAEAAKKPKR